MKYTSAQMLQNQWDTPKTQDPTKIQSKEELINHMIHTIRHIVRHPNSKTPNWAQTQSPMEEDKVWNNILKHEAHPIKRLNDLKAIAPNLYTTTCLENKEATTNNTNTTDPIGEANEPTLKGKRKTKTPT